MSSAAAQTLAKPEPDPGGISLAHYAALRASIAEGFPEAEVLKLEGLSLADYKNADLAWKVKLAQDAAALDHYRSALADAEDALSRGVRPLEDDALAWVSFLHAIETGSDSNALLADAGLGLNDLARLGRLWKKRADKNEKLSKELAELKKNARMMPKVSAGPKVLKKSPFARALERETSIETNPEEASNRWQKAHEAVKRHLFEKQADDRQEEPTRVEPLAPLIPIPQALVIPQPMAQPLMRTALAINIPRGPALPFEEGEAHLPPVEEKPARPSDSLSATALALNVPKGPALPFAKDAEKAPPALAGTSLTVDIPRGPALPFKEASPNEPPPILEEKPLPAILPKAPAGLGMTAPVLAVPKGDALPFPQSAEGDDLAKTVVVFKLPKDLAKPKAAPAPEKPKAPELAIHTYAALCAQLAKAPGSAEDIFRSFGLADPESRKAVDATWKQKLQSDPALYAEWTRLYQYYSRQ